MLLRSLFSLFSMCLLITPVKPAGAAPVTYTFDNDVSSFAGTDGWQASYCTDPWTTALNGGVVAKTDDGCAAENCGEDNNCGYEFTVWQGCQASDPLDNHIQFGSGLWEDYTFTARFKNTDDDSVGFVFRYHNSANFHLLFFTRTIGPDTTNGCSLTFIGSRVYRVHSGQVTQLAQSDITYTQGTEHAVRIDVEGDDFVIDFDVNGDGQFADGENLFTFTDSGGSDSGRVGFWAWENGSAAGNACADGSCWFDDLSVDVHTLGNDSCSGISYEGICDGKTLKYCQNGQIISQNCQACCMWFHQNEYYACGNWQGCQSCANECTNGQAGCSSEFTHSWSCGQDDDDDCLERVYLACEETGLCDVATSQCLGGGCDPQCGGKNCGADGCGGSCGQCAGNSVCTNGLCVCTPACGNKECGGDGCGGNCGNCPAGHQCQAGNCVCVPNCDGKSCGSDGCGGNCGTCGPGLTCTIDGICSCVPACTNKQCGDDGCGGFCGTCLVGESCAAGQCVCVPACDGMECGPDSCGGTCGVCAGNDLCLDGVCHCVPDCAGKACGDDGCGATCGDCPVDFFCEDGTCKEGECIPDCENKTCGNDACGGSCGPCGDNEECIDYACKPVICEPKCIDKTCGPDGCGGSCGECEGELACQDGICACAPKCDGKNCGADGCGGVCGECEPGWYCKYGLCSESECLPSCAGIECGDDGCGGVCGTCGEGFECTSNGVCQEIVDCDPKVAWHCEDDQLFWVDSCGNPGEKIQDCKYGCGEEECAPEPETDAGIPTTSDIIDEPDGSSAASGDVVTFGSGARSGGCSAGNGTPASAMLLLAFLLLALLHRRAYP